MRASPRSLLGDALAAAFLTASDWGSAELVDMGARALGARSSWLVPLAKDVLRAFPSPPLHDLGALARFIATDDRVRDACRSVSDSPRVREWLVPSLAMGAARWPVPQIATAGDLASWIGVEAPALSWLADARGLERLVRDEGLRHYRYRWVAKRSGGVRLLEEPKERTKDIQRRILHEILDVIPLHDAAHGFRRGRSVLSHASMHAGRYVVLRIDLSDFFSSITAAGVRAIFRALGYPAEVATMLAALCSNRAPPMPVDVEKRALGDYPSAADIDALRRTKMLVRAPHLPQGAPTSPAIANLCAFGLDVRLAAAANAIGATYSRYTDDLVFSGGVDVARRARRFEAFVAAVVHDEGFAVNFRKTRVMRHGGQQRIAGLVVNDRARASRETFDRVKAILHNCVRHGAASQNREGRKDFRAYLYGLVAWIATGDSARSERLTAMLGQIDWTVRQAP